MTELLTAAQMRAIEQAAIESGKVTGLALMERAGHGVVEAVFEEWPELREGARRAVVLCGPGNNGGDGFVVARLLKKAGWQVEVFLYGDAERLPTDARANLEKWEEFGDVLPLTTGWHQADAAPDVIVDALFGLGLSRPLSNELLAAVRPLNWHRWADAKGRQIRPKVVSIDIRSGVCADSGRVIVDPPPEAFTSHKRKVYDQNRSLICDLTVTFQRAKVGHFLKLGSLGCRKLRIVDIGLTNSRIDRVLCDDLSSVAEVANVGRRTSVSGDLDQVATILSKSDGHKFTHGHALILSGGPARTGAARLAARGALRIGAGLVTLGVPPAAQMEVAAQVTAVMIHRVADAAALGAVLDDARINALCLGPALGLSEDKVDLIATALASGRQCVFDADALTLIARSPALFAQLHGGCVLTPHGGEFARLFPDIAERLKAPATKGPAYSKVDATREAATRAGCTVLFKGPDTVIASPDGTTAINASVYDRAAPWLATAGSGDVLAGFIAGLLARGFPPQQAAETGAWLHTECALSFGPGLIAEDLPDQLPAVFKALGV